MHNTGYGSEVSDSREISRNNFHCENSTATTSAQNQNNVKSSHWRSGFRKSEIICLHISYIFQDK